MAKKTTVQADVEARVVKIRDALRDRTLSKVADATGLHVNTIRSIAKNSGQTFAVSTVDKLFSYLFPAGA